LAKLQARKLIVSCARSVRLGTVLLKDELARDLEYGEKQLLLLTVVTQIWIGLDNYKTGVDRFWLAN